MATFDVYPANERGHANFGWLDSRHTFSFGSWYNPRRMGFGALRVLNDDVVSGGMGFGKHPHDNMEIVSIPLEGELEHRDSMGNTAVIRKGDVQVMSAGTGIFHSEFNRNAGEEVRFLQIWVYPKLRNVAPRYDQITLPDEEAKNRFRQILSPNPDDEGVWVHQDAWFHRGRFEAGQSVDYAWKKAGNGLFVFVLSGQVEVEGHKMNARDGLAVSGTDRVGFSFGSESDVLLMEIPLESYE